MAFLDFLFGKSGQNKQYQRFTPEQQQAQNQILQQATSQLQGNRFDFEPIAQQARTQFNQETIPGLAERFTSMGNGAQKSSAFQGAIGQAGAGLEGNLAALKSQYGLQQQGHLQNLLGMGLQPQFENVYHARQPGLFESVLGAGAQGIGSLLPLLLLNRGIGGTQGGSFGQNQQLNSFAQQGVR